MRNDEPPEPRKSDLYPVVVRYSEEDEAYVATAPAWPFLAATGETANEALKEIQEVIAAAIEVSLRHGDPIPASDLLLSRLLQLKEIVNTAKLAELSGINENTLRAKLNRRSKFNKEEANRLKHVFEEIGVAL